MRFYFLLFLNQKSCIQFCLSVSLRPSFDLLPYGRISLLLGLRKSSLDFIFRNRIRFFVQRKIAGFKRTLCLGRFFYRVFDSVFFISGRNRIRGRFVRPRLRTDRRSSLVDVLFKRLLHSSSFVHGRSSRKRKKSAQGPDSYGFVFRDRIVFYFFEQNFF